MPKSGTTLVWKYQCKLIARASKDGKGDIFKIPYPRFVKEIDEEVAADLEKINSTYGGFLIKTHCMLNEPIKALVENGVARATYMFRDPRDIILSLIDHGIRSRNGLDPNKSFENIVTIEDAIRYTKWHVRVYKAWKEFGNALFIRYEDLIEDNWKYLNLVAAYLGYRLPEPVLDEILHNEQAERKIESNFNTGRSNRWKTEMTGLQKSQAMDAFGSDISLMGYEALSANHEKT